MGHPADKFITTKEGPFAIVKICTICGFFHTRPRGTGRGAGMKYGNMSRGILIQHIKADHPDHLENEICL